MFVFLEMETSIRLRRNPLMQHTTHDVIVRDAKGSINIVSSALIKLANNSASEDTGIDLPPIIPDMNLNINPVVFDTISVEISGRHTLRIPFIRQPVLSRHYMTKIEDKKVRIYFIDKAMLRGFTSLAYQFSINGVPSSKPTVENDMLYRFIVRGIAEILVDDSNGIMEINFLEEGTYTIAIVDAVSETSPILTDIAEDAMQDIVQAINYKFKVSVFNGVSVLFDNGIINITAYGITNNLIVKVKDSNNEIIAENTPELSDDMITINEGDCVYDYEKYFTDDVLTLRFGHEGRYRIIVDGEESYFNACGFRPLRIIERSNKSAVVELPYKNDNNYISLWKFCNSGWNVVKSIIAKDIRCVVPIDDNDDGVYCITLNGAQPKGVSQTFLGEYYVMKPFDGSWKPRRLTAYELGNLNVGEYYIIDAFTGMYENISVTRAIGSLNIITPEQSNGSAGDAAAAQEVEPLPFRRIELRYSANNRVALYHGRINATRVNSHYVKPTINMLNTCYISDMSENSTRPFYVGKYYNSCVHNIVESAYGGIAIGKQKVSVTELGGYKLIIRNGVAMHTHALYDVYLYLNESVNAIYTAFARDKIPTTWFMVGRDETLEENMNAIFGNGECIGMNTVALFAAALEDTIKEIYDCEFTSNSFNNQPDRAVAKNIVFVNIRTSTPLLRQADACTFINCVSEYHEGNTEAKPMIETVNNGISMFGCVSISNVVVNASMINEIQGLAEMRMCSAIILKYIAPYYDEYHVYCVGGIIGSVGYGVLLLQDSYVYANEIRCDFTGSNAQTTGLCVGGVVGATYGAMIDTPYKSIAAFKNVHSIIGKIKVNCERTLSFNVKRRPIIASVGGIIAVSQGAMFGCSTYIEDSVELKNTHMFGGIAAINNGIISESSVYVGGSINLSNTYRDIFLLLMEDAPIPGNYFVVTGLTSGINEVLSYNNNVYIGNNMRAMVETIKTSSMGDYIGALGIVSGGVISFAVIEKSLATLYNTKVYIGKDIVTNGTASQLLIDPNEQNPNINQAGDETDAADETDETTNGLGLFFPGRKADFNLGKALRVNLQAYTKTFARQRLEGAKAASDPLTHISFSFGIIIPGFSTDDSLAIKPETNFNSYLYKLWMSAAEHRQVVISAAGLAYATGIISILNSCININGDISSKTNTNTPSSANGLEPCDVYFHNTAAGGVSTLSLAGISDDTLEAGQVLSSPRLYRVMLYDTNINVNGNIEAIEDGLTWINVDNVKNLSNAITNSFLASNAAGLVNFAFSVNAYNCALNIGKGVVAITGDLIASNISESIVSATAFINEAFYTHIYNCIANVQSNIIARARGGIITASGFVNVPLSYIVGIYMGMDQTLASRIRAHLDEITGIGTTIQKSKLCVNGNIEASRFIYNNEHNIAQPILSILCATGAASIAAPTVSMSRNSIIINGNIISKKYMLNRNKTYLPEINVAQIGFLIIKEPINYEIASGIIGLQLTYNSKIDSNYVLVKGCVEANDVSSGIIAYDFTSAVNLISLIPVLAAHTSLMMGHFISIYLNSLQFLNVMVGNDIQISKIYARDENGASAKCVITLTSGQDYLISPANQVRTIEQTASPNVSIMPFAFVQPLERLINALIDNKVNN